MELCRSEKLISPVLILLYSTIDIASYLNSASASTRERFVLWCDTYLLKAKQLPCTALELYGARCGVVHAMSPDSDLSTAGKVRRIIYAWGDSEVDTLQSLLELTRMSDYVAVKLEELVEAYRLGLAFYIKDLEQDQDKAALAEERAPKVFTHMSKERAQALLDWGRSMTQGIWKEFPSD